jgi:hypothetical protein
MRGAQSDHVPRVRLHLDRVMEPHPWNSAYLEAKGLSCPKCMTKALPGDKPSWAKAAFGVTFLLGLLMLPLGFVLIVASPLFWLLAKNLPTRCPSCGFTWQA